MSVTLGVTRFTWVTVPNLVIDMPFWGISLAPRWIDMSHMLWDCGPRPPQRDGHTLGAPPPQHVHRCEVWMLGTPSARTPIAIGRMERVYPKWCAAIQGSLSRGNKSAPQILEAVLVQPSCATIPGVHAVALSPMVDLEGLGNVSTLNPHP